MGREELKASAVNFGFDTSWIADVLTKYGDKVLALAIEGTRNGLSVAFVMEVLNNFGPDLLEFLLSLLTRQKMAAFSRSFGEESEVMPGPWDVGMDTTFLQMLIEKYLPVILQNYLPAIMEKYGPQLIQLVVQAILNSLKPKTV